MVCEVAPLEHELGDDAMERGSLVAEPLLVGAQLTEVLGGLGHFVVVQFHGDPSRREPSMPMSK